MKKSTLILGLGADAAAIVDILCKQRSRDEDVDLTTIVFDDETASHHEVTRLKASRLGQGSRADLMRQVAEKMQQCSRCIIVTRFSSTEVNELLPQLVRLAGERVQCFIFSALPLSLYGVSSVEAASNTLRKVSQESDLCLIADPEAVESAVNSLDQVGVECNRMLADAVDSFLSIFQKPIHGFDSKLFLNETRGRIFYMQFSRVRTQDQFLTDDLPEKLLGSSRLCNHDRVHNSKLMLSSIRLDGRIEIAKLKDWQERLRLCQVNPHDFCALLPVDENEKGEMSVFFLCSAVASQVEQMPVRQATVVTESSLNSSPRRLHSRTLDKFDEEELRRPAWQRYNVEINPC